MREFNKILIDSKEHSNLLGSYESYDGELIIHAGNHLTINVFKDLLRNRIKINDLIFENNNDINGEFTGPYLIRKIESSSNGSIIILQK